MKNLWELVICGRIKGRDTSELNLYHWVARLTKGEISIPMRLELKDLLAPKLILQESNSLYSMENEEVNTEPTRIDDLFHWELVLNSDHARTVLDYKRNVFLMSALPTLLEDFEDLLRDAINLLKSLGVADENSDRSFLSLPSISPHKQNRRFKIWPLLIELVRDAWLELLEKDFNRAKLVPTRWFNMTFPVFKRLAFYAVRHDKVAPSDEWVLWLTGSNAGWLWSPETAREVYRLLVLQGKNLSRSASHILEETILEGPPRCMYSEDTSDEKFKSLCDREIWLVLAKLELSGHVLGAGAKRRLKELSRKHPYFKLAEDERDEFAIWMGDSFTSDFKSDRNIEIAPDNCKDMVKWLRKNPMQNHPFAEDEWKERCSSHLTLCLGALDTLAQENFVPVERWKTALQAWSMDGLKTQSWEKAAPIVNRLTDDKLQEMVHYVSRWIAVSANTTSKHRKIFMALC